MDGGLLGSHQPLTLEGFLDLFPGRKNVYYSNPNALDGTEETLTVVVQTDTHSIGD